MKHAASQELYAYWNSVRRGGTAPLRGAIEPAGIRSILADTLILESGRREMMPIRLAGTRICSLHGRELKGTDFFELWQNMDSDALKQILTAVSREGSVAVMTAEGRTRANRRIACELVLTPLRHNGPSFDRIIGSCVALDRPYWLGADPVEMLSLASMRLIKTDEILHHPSSDQGRTRNAAVSDDPAGSVLLRLGHLALLQGGKGKEHRPKE